MVLLSFHKPSSPSLASQCWRLLAAPSLRGAPHRFCCALSRTDLVASRSPPTDAPSVARTLRRRGRLPQTLRVRPVLVASRTRRCSAAWRSHFAQLAPAWRAVGFFRSAVFLSEAARCKQRTGGKSQRCPCLASSLAIHAACRHTHIHTYQCIDLVLRD